MPYTAEQKKAYAIKMKGAKDAKSKRTYAKAAGKKIYSKYAGGYKYKPKKDEGIISAFNNGLKGLGNTIATNMIGSIPGIGQIMGKGDYKVKSNTLYSATDSVPQFGNKNRAVYVRHREYIGDVISGAANTFNIQKYVINPALGTTFPWLASVAQQYEEYKIKGMIFEFKTMSADALNSTNTALGQVIMATQYNVLSPDFINKQQMENYEFACSTKPSCSVIHPIECEPHETPLTELFTRSLNTAIVGSDARLYDFGNFYIATNGMQSGFVNLGELWVSYEIKLFKPKLGAQVQVADHYRAAGTVNTGAYLGGNAVKTTSSNFGTIWNGTNTLTFPGGFTGQVFIEYNMTGTANGLSAITMTGSQGVTNLNIFNSSGTNGVTNQGVSSSQFIQCATFNVNGGGVLTFSGGALPTAITAGDMFVMAIPLTN